MWELHPRRFFLDTWAAINAEAEAGRSSPTFDARVAVVLVTVALSLTLMEYLGSRATFRDLFGDVVPISHPYAELWSYAYWSGCRVLGYVAIPCLVVRFLRGERLRDYGLATRGLLEHLWIYGAMFAIVLPAVVLVSYRDDFRHYYPFYDQAGRSLFDFLVWELVYGVQFVALEFFFRGFMLQGLKRTMGAYSIFVMVVPYAMIHFGKPFLETLAAILAGIVLGTLALRTRSIWCGALIHVSVAISMDVAALWQRGALPS